MTRDEAKEILAGCRLNTTDQDDPQYVAALELALSDPELNRWLNEQQSFHARVREEMRGIQAPNALKTRILAGKPEPISFWRRHEILAIAASVALLLSIIGFWMSRPRGEEQNLANFSSRMMAFALRTYQMDIVTPDRAAIRAFLKERGAPDDFPLTPGLEKIPAKGGGRLSWHNKPVAMMCFKLPGNETAFMFVIDERSISKTEDLANRARVMAGFELHTAMWRKDGRVFLLAAPGRVETVAELAAY